MEELITNRKLQGSYYNLSDITRVQSYIDFIADKKGITLPKYEWSKNECVYYHMFTFYILNNVTKLAALFDNFPTDFATPTADNWNYIKANKLEQILNYMYNLVK
jgi:hypothetical protein